MTEEIIKQLLEAGVHFGHQTKRWNPKMAPFIFGKRSSIYIIDLEKTAGCLERARDFLKETACKGEAVLFVGTKRQAQNIIKEKAAACGMYWVSQRWLGGFLTNFVTIKKSIARLKDIEKMKDDGRFDSISKKEVILLLKEQVKLEKNFGGIKNMERLPGALFVVDPKKEQTAVNEARKLNIPIVALIDTNCDPQMVDYPIPGNDDAIKSIAMVTTLISESVAQGRKDFLEYLTQDNVKTALQGSEGKMVALGGGVLAEDEAKAEEELIERVEEVVVKDSEDKTAKSMIKVKPAETVGGFKGKKSPYKK